MAKFGIQIKGTIECASEVEAIGVAKKLEALLARAGLRTMLKVDGIKLVSAEVMKDERGIPRVTRE